MYWNTINYRYKYLECLLVIIIIVMYLHRRNPFNGKYYRVNIYDENKYMTYSPYTFDKNAHDNSITPMIIDPYVCGYCDTRFCSRNKLFHHLAYIGINIFNDRKIYHENKKKKRRYRPRHENIQNKRLRQNINEITRMFAKIW